MSIKNIMQCIAMLTMLAIAASAVTETDTTTKTSISSYTYSQLIQESTVNFNDNNPTSLLVFLNSPNIDYVLFNITTLNGFIDQIHEIHDTNSNPSRSDIQQYSYQTINSRLVKRDLNNIGFGKVFLNNGIPQIYVVDRKVRNILLFYYNYFSFYFNNNIIDSTNHQILY